MFICCFCPLMMIIYMILSLTYWLTLLFSALALSSIAFLSSGVILILISACLLKYFAFALFFASLYPTYAIIRPPFKPIIPYFSHVPMYKLHNFCMGTLFILILACSHVRL